MDSMLVIPGVQGNTIERREEVISTKVCSRLRVAQVVLDQIFQVPYKRHIRCSSVWHNMQKQGTNLQVSAARLSQDC